MQEGRNSVFTMKPLAMSVPILLLISIFALHLITAADYRLSKDVYPLRYNIFIKPYFLPEDGDKRFTFDGETSIIFRSSASGIREFAVHAVNMNFSQFDLWTDNGLSMKLTSEYEAETNKIIFRLEEDMRTLVNYTLTSKYKGRISTGMDGLYEIHYTDEEDTEKFMVATQLQRTDARKVFPCFDEPGFKAVFTIHINRPKNVKSYSNTAILRTTADENDPQRYVDHFADTPLMSSYLVAIVVADYKTRGEENLRIISRPEYYDKTEFSFNVTKKMLSKYNDLFARYYRDLGNPLLQKLSLSKFPHNGMENWGLMIYKDDVLVYEDGNTDLSGQQYTITIISHETSHSWFGDTITFEWWGYFWLNEGFARYYQYFASHAVYPEYELDKQFVVDQLQYIFDKDAGNSTQALSEPDVTSPSEIAGKFSSITYVKGATVLRMISNAMSETNFEEAIRHYITDNLSRSVIPSDLLKWLKLFWPASPNVDVDEFFYDWTEQVGFPLLTVNLADNNSSITIQQQRYLVDSEDGSDPSIRYTIPLTYTTSADPNFTNTFPVQYFNKYQKEVILNFSTPVDWYVLNIQQTSYYRVMYDNTSWHMLFNALNKENWSGIHEINRAQFVDDLLAFAQAAILHYDWVFKMLEYLRNEIHYTPWEAAFNGFNFVTPFLTAEEHEDFGSYILFVTEKVFNNLGVLATQSNETVVDVYNRKRIVHFNCKYGRRACTSGVHSVLRNYLYYGVVIPVDIRGTIYCSGMRDGSEEDFDQLLKKFNAEKVQREKLRMRYGLGCVRKSINIKKFFEVVLSDAVPLQEKDVAIAPLYKENPENVWPVYKMVTSRYAEVAEAFESWTRTANLISSIANLLTTEDQRDDFKEFVDKNRFRFGISVEVLDYALQTVDKNLKWAETHLSSLRLYLKSKNYASATNCVNVFLITLTIVLYVFG